MRLQINVSCSGYEVRLAELGTMWAERAEINLNPGERGVLPSPGMVWSQSLLCPPATGAPKQPQTNSHLCFQHPDCYFPLFCLFLLPCSLSTLFLLLLQHFLAAKQPQQVKGDEVSHFSIILRISLAWNLQHLFPSPFSPLKQRILYHFG